MGNRKSITNILCVMLGNISTIISGVVMGFLLPKVLSLSDYGFYKTFTLYITYTGLFSAGIIDGIILKYGSNDYEELDRPLFRSYFKFFTALIATAAAAIIIVGLLFAEGDVQFIFMMVGIDMIAGNMTNYFRQISQITQRFQEYSRRIFLQSFIRILIILSMLFLFYAGYEVGYRLFLTLIVLSDVLLTLWYITTYHELVFGSYETLARTRPLIHSLIKTGFPLLFANLTVQIIMALDRQFVSWLFNKEEYAIYAFAYNMMSLVTVAISAISTVLYPTLKRTNPQNLKNNYGSLISIILMLVFGLLLLFFPLCWFLEWFLPQYTPSIEIFRIIFPGLAISSAISITMHNYYKVMNKSVVFFKKSVVILVLSAIANFAAYSCFRTMTAISKVSILTLLIWYFYAESYFVKDFGYNRWKNLSYLCLVMVLFYIISSVNQGLIGMIEYLFGYALISAIFFKDILIHIKNRSLFE